jgi:hypothetical protein
MDNKQNVNKALDSSQDNMIHLLPQPECKNEAAIRVREKRWQVFVARAAFRFEVWWKLCVPNQFEGKLWPELRTITIEEEITVHWPTSAKAMVKWITPDKIPPLGMILLLL